MIKVRQFKLTLGKCSRNRIQIRQHREVIFRFFENPRALRRVPALMPKTRLFSRQKAIIPFFPTMPTDCNGD